MRLAAAVVLVTSLLLSACADSPRTEGRTAPTRAVDEVLWNGDFESGGVPEQTGCKKDREQDKRGSQGGATQPPSRGRDQYLRIEGHGGCGEVDIVRSPTRTETSKHAGKVFMPRDAQRSLWVADYPWHADEDGSESLWFGVSVYFDEDWDLSEIKSTSGQFLSMISWRSVGDGSLTVQGKEDGHLYLRRSVNYDWPDGLGADDIDLGPIVLERWIDLVFHIRFSTSDRNAERRGWRDGELMGRKTSRNAVDSEYRWRIGIYQGPGVGHGRTLYIDNAFIGSSYEAVDPAASL